jgi:hypothetical protein
MSRLLHIAPPAVVETLTGYRRGVCGSLDEARYRAETLVERASGSRLFPQFDLLCLGRRLDDNACYYLDAAGGIYLGLSALTVESRVAAI